MCTKARRECVQKPSALADECVVHHFQTELENQSGDGYYFRRRLFVHAYYVRSSCSKNLISKCGSILFLLTTEGRKSYGNSPNFTYHRSCMFISIVCKNKRTKSSAIGMTDTLGSSCWHAFSLTNAFEVRPSKRQDNHNKYLYTDLSTRMGRNEFVVDVRGLHRLDHVEYLISNN